VPPGYPELLECFCPDATGLAAAVTIVGDLKDTPLGRKGK